MPRVTLTNTQGQTATNSGGCFGFCGRSRGRIASNFGSLGNIRDTNKITNFQFHFGETMTGGSKVGLNDPLPMLKWVVEQSSWAKYMQDNNNLETLTSETRINIRCDIPGHCVIGAASAVRMIRHRKNDLLPFWNQCVQLGANPAIALLVYYAMFSNMNRDFKVDSQGKLTLQTQGNSRLPKANGGSGKIGMGDDEVMRLNKVDPGLIYSFIEGEFEMKRKDRNEERYETSGYYTQNILNSFNGNTNPNLGKQPTASLPLYLMNRFHSLLPVAETQRFQDEGGMGSVNRKTLQSPIYESALIGWVLQLTSEFKIYKRFLGWK